jgi:hypothetical protein
MDLFSRHFQMKVRFAHKAPLPASSSAMARLSLPMADNRTSLAQLPLREKTLVVEYNNFTKYLPRLLELDIARGRCITLAPQTRMAHAGCNRQTASDFGAMPS